MRTLVIVRVTTSLSYLNLSTFYYCEVKSSELLKIIIRTKKKVVIDRKDERHKVNIYLQQNYK